MRGTKHIPVLAIWLLYLGVGALYATYTPAWQAPDEPAHYQYVRQLAAGQWPVMEPGDYDEAYKNAAVSAGFGPTFDLTRFSYEDWQPPLYYLILTPLFRLSAGSLLALRLASLLLGGGVVLLAAAIAGRVWPAQPWLAWSTAAVVAFLPQHLAIMASVNNDALAELLIAAVLWQLLAVTGRQPQRRSSLWLGLWLGLGLLTKGTVYPLVGVVVVALSWRFWRAWPALWRTALGCLGPALLLGLPWWGRNLAVYGGLDVLGKAAHDAVVVGQPRTAALVAQLGLPAAVGQLLRTTFNSFWGQFGWMALPMLHPSWLYPGLALLTTAAVLGLVLRWRRPPGWAGDGGPNGNPGRSRATIILATLFLLTLLVHLGYNVTFIQHQGRYLFPALVPIAVGFSLGLAAWHRWLGLPWPWLVPLGLSVGLLALDLWALFWIIVPNLG